MASYISVESDNVSSGIRDNLRAALEDYLTDPTSQVKRHFVYERDPHVKSASFDGYPVVIIHDYSVIPQDETLNGYHVTYEGTFEVTIEADEDNPSHLDSLSDELVNLAQGNTARTKLGEYGIANLNINRDDRVDGIDVAENFILRRNMELTFMMKVDMG